MKRTAPLVALLCSLALVPGFADSGKTAKTDAIAAIRREARDNSRVMAHLQQLTGEIGPRLTGSDNINKAYKWAEKTFRDMGLEVRLEQWGEWEVGFNRGEHSGRMIIGDASTTLTIGTDAWLPGTKGAVRAPAILEPTTEAEFEAIKDKLPGAWVVARDRRRLGRRGMRAALALTRKVRAAGIAGRLNPVRGELIVTGGRYRGLKPNKLPKDIEIEIVHSEWETIVKAIEAGKPVELEFDIQNRFKPGSYKHYNVIADLKGSEKPNEIVVVGGHLDSWDGATGATDNGTGVATTIEAARILTAAGVKPKRTIRFMLWSGEEQGLLGSREYVKKHRDEMERISAVLVHDGGTNACLGINATPAMRSQIDRAFAPLIGDGHELAFEIATVNGLRGGGSDHSSFLAAGVPGFFWVQKGRAKYNYTHHTQHDNIDQVIPEYQKRSSEIIAIGALGIANLDKLLSRKSLIAKTGRRKVLGVQLDGLTITAVEPGSVAANAGFRPGDRILAGNKRPIVSMEWLRAVIRDAEGETEFLVLRDGKELTLIADFPKVRRRKMLGVMLDNMTITDVVAGSVADQAGFKAGDEIVKGGGEEIGDRYALGAVIEGSSGKTPFVVRRDGKLVTLMADFGPGPEAPKTPKKPATPKKPKKKKKKKFF